MGWGSQRFLLTDIRVIPLAPHCRRGEDDEAWSCRQCRQGYDMEAIEQRLVIALNQYVRSYELQVCERECVYVCICV